MALPQKLLRGIFHHGVFQGCRKDFTKIHPWILALKLTPSYSDRECQFLRCVEVSASVSETTHRQSAAHRSMASSDNRDSRRRPVGFLTRQSVHWKGFKLWSSLELCRRRPFLGDGSHLTDTLSSRRCPRRVSDNFPAITGTRVAVREGLRPRAFHDSSPPHPLST
jgi:hypothetical protein